MCRVTIANVELPRKKAQHAGLDFDKSPMEKTTTGVLYAHKTYPASTQDLKKSGSDSLGMTLGHSFSNSRYFQGRFSWHFAFSKQQG